MAEAAEENQDQSMEEILQSIKRIIADEDEESPDTDQQADAVDADPHDEMNSDDMEDSGSAVLELTELVQEDGTVTNLDEEESGADSAPLEPSPPPAKPPKTEAKPMDDESLISEDAAAASASALNNLKSKEQPAPKPAPQIESPSFRSGATVEDLVMESLKPMLKEWLDANLPSIVEHLVEKEIKRISDK